MTVLSKYATALDIRAVLGVTPEELEDATLAVPLYLRQLQFILADIDPLLESTYLSTVAVSSKTTVQQKFVDVVQTFCAYAVSKELLTSLSLFAPRRITDGRAEVERVIDPYEDVRDGVDAAYNTLLDRVRTTYAALGNTITTTATRTFPLSAAAGLAINPVTGA